MVGNFGSLLTVIEAFDNPVIQLIGRAAAGQGGDLSAPVRG